MQRLALRSVAEQVLRRCLSTKGKDVKFGAEERFSFVLRSSLEIKR